MIFGSDLTRYLVSFVFVLALIGLFAWLLRRFGPAGQLRLGRGPKRLEIMEITSLDARRRLILVRRDQREHLVLIGGPNDLVIESGITHPPGPPTGSFADALDEAPR